MYVGHGGSLVELVPFVRRFESRSSHHVATLGTYFTRRYPWRFGVKLRHNIRAVS